MKFRGKVLKVKLVFVSMVVLLAKKSKSKQVIRDETTGTTVQHWSNRNLFRVLARCVNKNKNQFDEIQEVWIIFKRLQTSIGFLVASLLIRFRKI